MSSATRRLTVAQALVRFLIAQHSERDGATHRLVEGCFGIFGHGNLAGLGEALLEGLLSFDRGWRGGIGFLRRTVRTMARQWRRDAEECGLFDAEGRQ